jgi:ceramide glucosyltransferase
MAHLFFLIGVVGTLSSTVFLGLAFTGAAKFCRERRLKRRHSHFPAVSLLKPLHGMEPQLERNLESFFEQDFPAPFQLLFCARSNEDEGLRLARAVAARCPHVDATFVLAGDPPYTNAKVWSLQQMEKVAKYDLLLVSDSDVEVGPDYLSAVLTPFADPQVGCVTCLYRGKPTGGLPSRLEGLGMSVEMTSGVLIANLLEGMKFALGPTMIVRREALAQIGGFAAFADYCSDDFLLGNWVAERGWTVVLSDYIIDHVILNRSWADSLRHQVRWMKSTRFSRPKGHFGTGLTFAVPYGILSLAAAYALGIPRWGWALFTWSIASRILQSAIIGWFVVRDRRAVTSSWLYPVRDFMGFFFWAASYANSKILWRGQSYTLVRDGKMVRDEQPVLTTEPVRD